MERLLYEWRWWTIRQRARHKSTIMQTFEETLKIKMLMCLRMGYTVLMWHLVSSTEMQSGEASSGEGIVVASASILDRNNTWWVCLYGHIYFSTLMTRTHTHAHKHAHMHTHPCIQACIHTYTHTHGYTNTRAYKHAHIHTHTDTHAHVHIQADWHKHMHTTDTQTLQHLHTLSLISVWQPAALLISLLVLTWAAACSGPCGPVLLG